VTEVAAAAIEVNVVAKGIHAASNGARALQVGAEGVGGEPAGAVVPRVEVVVVVEEVLRSGLARRAGAVTGAGGGAVGHQAGVEAAVPPHGVV